MVYRIHGYKKYEKSREVLLDTYIEVDKKSTVERLYLLFFIMLHVCFIVFLIAVAFVLSRTVCYIPSMGMNVKFKTQLFVQLSFILIFVFYWIL